MKTMREKKRVETFLKYEISGTREHRRSKRQKDTGAQSTTLCNV